MLQAFLVSTGVVALGEIGDKTQLLALLLAARYRKRYRSSWASWWPRWPTMPAPARWATGSRAASIRNGCAGPGSVLPGGGGVDADPS